MARLLKASSPTFNFKSLKKPEPKGFNPSPTRAQKNQAQPTSTFLSSQCHHFCHLGANPSARYERPSFARTHKFLVFEIIHVKVTETIQRGSLCYCIQRRTAKRRNCILASNCSNGYIQNTKTHIRAEF
jgi:hypothetical protein